MEALDADTIRNWSPGSSTVSLDRGFRGHGFADGHKASGSVFDKRQPNVGRSPTLAQQPSSSTVGQIWARSELLTGTLKALTTGRFSQTGNHRIPDRFPL
jgi:hypothetical protein